MSQILNTIARPRSLELSLAGRLAAAVLVSRRRADAAQRSRLHRCDVMRCDATWCGSAFR